MSDGFKVPSLPHAGPSKRKYPEDSNGTSNKRSRPTVEDESDPVAAPSSSKTKRTYNFAPSIPIKSSAGSVTTDVGAKARQIDEDDVEMRGDETFEADEGDEEGRFFGGGTNETQEVRIHSRGAMGQLMCDLSSANPRHVRLSRRRHGTFHSCSTKTVRSSLFAELGLAHPARTPQTNHQVRTHRPRFADDPSKYLDSEADLDKAFTFFYPLTQDPLTFYPELAHHDTLISTLVNLLTHENTDISLQAIGVIYELTDEDVGEELVDEADRDDEDSEEKREEVARKVRLAMGELMTALVSTVCVQALLR
jgi:beta-catenin-like protein 1